MYQKCPDIPALPQTPYGNEPACESNVRTVSLPQTPYGNEPACESNVRTVSLPNCIT